MNTPYDWSTGPIGPGWFIMIAPVQRYSGGSGFAILPSAKSESGELKKKKRIKRIKELDEIVVALMLGEDL